MRGVARRAIALVAQPGAAPTPMLQRRLRPGYARAGRLIEVMERRGVISGYDGPRLRQVLIGEADGARLVSELGRASGSGR
jgi:DNA segregation ATPase FtsK/SpoIIIE, S-DNA-T family